ncbi:MAG TPA: lysylphosphatidylglycerol synthase transmembrane domain-containing protein [Thermomicrobiales bacterium]|nr:lysylphosphatidylglycerol synthase transmembrane domain-containing protein [Thermomicrobiales bacterium]
MPIVRSLVRQGRAVFARYGVFIWLTLLALLAVGFVARQQDEIKQISAALAAADQRWLAGIVAIQLVAIALSGLTYQVILRRLGHRVRLHQLIDLHLQRHVVGTLTPVGGPASVYVLIRNLARRGVSTDDAVLTTTLRSATGYASFVLLLIPTFLFHRPSGIALIGAAVLVVMLVVLASAIFLLLHQSRHSHLPGRLQRRLPARVVAFVDHARDYGIRVPDLAWPFAVGLAQNLVNATALFVALRAMHQDVSPVVVLVGFTAGTMFSLVAPVFQGIGLVEVSMAVALQQMGVPVPAAIGAALLFRLGDLWLPLILGLAALGLGALIAGASDGTLLPVFGSSSALGPDDLVSLLVAIVGAAVLAWAYGHWRESQRLRLVALSNLAIVVPVVGLLYTPHVTDLLGVFSFLA